MVLASLEGTFKVLSSQAQGQQELVLPDVNRIEICPP